MVLLLSAALLSGACGAEAERGIETMARAPERTRTVTCDLDEAAIRAAVETFELLEGRAPTSIDDLVPAVLHTAPIAVTIDAEGHPVLTAEGEAAGCVLSEGRSESSVTDP